MEIIFLGTSCMVPTKERNHPGVFISYKGTGILVDCGENTQRQLKSVKLRPSQINKILLTHWHGDHVLGLPGLLQTISGSNYDGTLEIYGPKGTKEFMKHMFKAFIFDNRINMKIIEITKTGRILDTKDYYIEAYRLEHRVPTYGFRFIEKDRRRIKVSYVRKLGIPDGPVLGQLQKGKDVSWKNRKIKAKDATYIVEGKKIGLISDTVICNNCFKIAQDADVLISEATYTHELKEKAEEYKHITAREAAQIASRSNAKKLILTHLSQRYKSPREVKEDASDVFKNTDVAYDFMKVKI